MSPLKSVRSGSWRLFALVPLASEDADVSAFEVGVAEGIAEGVDSGVDVAEEIAESPPIVPYGVWPNSTQYHQHIIGGPGEHKCQ